MSAVAEQIRLLNEQRLLVEEERLLVEERRLYQSELRASAELALAQVDRMAGEGISIVEVGATRAGIVRALTPTDPSSGTVTVLPATSGAITTTTPTTTTATDPATTEAPKAGGNVATCAKSLREVDRARVFVGMDPKFNFGDDLPRVVDGGEHLPGFTMARKSESEWSSDLADNGLRVHLHTLANMWFSCVTFAGETYVGVDSGFTPEEVVERCGRSLRNKLAASIRANLTSVEIPKADPA